MKGSDGLIYFALNFFVNIYWFATVVCAYLMLPYAAFGEFVNYSWIWILYDIIRAQLITVETASKQGMQLDIRETNKGLEGIM